MSTDRNLAALSKHIDQANLVHVQAMERWELEALAIDLIRIVKVAEERGEVVDAHIGATGANPRKGYYGCIDDVVKELLDVAATALCAVEHFQGNDGASTLPMLFDHIHGLAQRVGVLVTEGASEGSEGKQ